MTEDAGNQTTTASRARAALRSPRLRRFGKWLAALLVVFGLFGFFAAPPLAKHVLLQQLSKTLHREVGIEKIDINPFALTARINGFSIKAQGGKEVAGFDELFVNLSSFSILRAGVVVDEITLRGPRVAVARVAEGRYDISDLLDEWMKPKDEPPSPMPRFSLNNIQIIGGKVEFDDQPKDRRHAVTDIQLGLPFISSLPYQAEILVEPSFSATVNGSPLLLKGRSKPFSARHESELDLDLERLDLAGFQPYLPATLPLRLNAGTLDTELKVVFKELADQVFSLAVVGSAHVSGMDLAESGGQPLIAWKRLDVDLEHADLINRKIAVKRVALEDPAVNLSVNRAGEFNVLALLARMTTPVAAEAAPPQPAKPLEWSLGEFALNDGVVHWHDHSRAVPVVGEVLDLHVKVGKVDSRLSDPIEIGEVSFGVDLGERLRVARMSLNGIRVDLPGHRIDIAEVSNVGAQARMLRNKAGQIERVSPPLLKTSRATDAKAGEQRPWVGSVAKLDVDNLTFRFDDQATKPAATQELKDFSLHGENLSSEAGKKGKIALSGKLNGKGGLNAEGNVTLSPLNLALKIDTTAIPLMPLEPYFGERLNIAVSRGQVSNRGEATVSLDDGGLKANYKGSVTLGDFLAVDKLNNADFLKWKSLYVGGIDFRLQPMAINVGEIALSDFYSRLILSQAGRLNVQDIVRQPEGEAVPVVPADPAKAAPAKPVKEAAPAKPPLPINIAKITVQNGTVNFSDFFVKPNYTVNLTKLGGRVAGLSSAPDSVADLELRGRYANTAPVQILAKLNPLAAQAYLDLKAEVTGVDLVGFSPYSGKYAGYNIEKGKLSLNVAYKLQNRALTAENKLFIDQLTFGERVESPDATKLPVNLAISLLKNNRGEIDLNLPISGSLDDPQFSVGGMIIKVIVNLFVKAVSSPFALLGSMFGGGEELSTIAFAPGRATIDEAGGKKLEVLAKALSERASLDLEVTGRAHPEIDKEGLKRVAIERAMKAEKLKDKFKKSGEGESLDNIEIAPEEYKTYLTRAYKEAKFPKPRNVIGLQKDLPVEEMEKLMLTNLPVSDEDVRALAVRRADVVQSWLIEQGKVAPARVFLLPPAIAADAQGGRVDFSLR